MSEEAYKVALPEGTDIGGYRLLRVLGDGGFGITYMAENFRKARFAIKEYLPNQFAVRDGLEVHPKSEASREDFEWGRAQFLEEANMLLRFNHPNIVHVAHFLEANNTAYIVMEYEDGEPLDKLLLRRGALTEPQLLAVLLPITDGLREIHAQNVWHRDIKPSNIFVRRSDESPVLLDFGAARNALGVKSKSIEAIVSPPYSPPEQYYSEGKLGAYTDIYALCALCYRAIAGEPPAESPHRQRRVYGKKEDPLPRLVDAPPRGYSKTLLAAVDWGLRLEEAERPQSVAEWLATVEGAEPSGGTDRAEEHGDVENAGAKSSERTTGKRQRRARSGRLARVSALAGAAALVVVLALAALKYDALVDRPPPEAPPKEDAGGSLPIQPPSIVAPPTPRPQPDPTPAPAPAPGPGPAPETQPFTVRTGPPDARIQIMNISPRYQPGIELPSGSYRVRATAPGFDMVERTVEHGDEPTSVWIGLPFRDCEICPKMVEVPTGHYTMGTSGGSGGSDRDRDEGPAHPVAIEVPIAVGVYEVSFEEWDACRRDGRCQRHLADNGRGRGELPVVNAAVSDAREYAGWLAEKTHRPYRLLSEAEWEYAARAGEQSIRHWEGEESQCAHENGADAAALQEYEDWPVADCTDGFVRAAPGAGGHFRPNPWGLYHMLGNVSEWTEDCWHASYEGAPEDGSPWNTRCQTKDGENDENKRTRVARGGSWASAPRGVRASIRLPYDRAERRQDLGFRVAVRSRKSPAVSFTLDNQSDVVILLVEASPDYALQWGEDLLGSAVLWPGDQRRFDVSAQADQCVFDIRVHWSDSTRSWMGRDLCEDAHVVFDGPPAD